LSDIFGNLNTSNGFTSDEPIFNKSDYLKYRFYIFDEEFFREFNGTDVFVKSLDS